MKRLLFAATVFLLPHASMAQQVMDGSGDKISHDIAQEIATALQAVTNDPYSAQFIKLHRATDDPATVCGFVNLKNASGGYTGFQPFYLMTHTNEAQLMSRVGCE